MNNELSIFITYLEKKSLRLTRQREYISQKIFTTKKHFSVEDMVDVFKNNGGTLGRVTIYRTIALLVDAGLLSEIDFNKGCKHYERSLNRASHAHLVCKRCGKVTEFASSQLENIINKIRATKAFEDLSYDFKATGVCSACKRK
jgi:Fur family ferric uptake transcriptional regulator